MSDLKKAISGNEKYQEGWLGVSPLEEKKYNPDTKYKEKNLLYIVFILLLKQFTTLFAQHTSQLPYQNSSDIEGLLNFKKILTALSQNDQSHNPEFLEKFIQAWEALPHHHTALPSTLSSLLKEIESYADPEGFSLGFYLERNAGKEWLPFPFMHILHQLHTEYQHAAEHSALKKWIDTLSTVVENLAPI